MENLKEVFIRLRYALRSFLRIPIIKINKSLTAAELYCQHIEQVRTNQQFFGPFETLQLETFLNDAAQQIHQYLQNSQISRTQRIETAVRVPTNGRQPTKFIVIFRR